MEAFKKDGLATVNEGDGVNDPSSTDTQREPYVEDGAPGKGKQRKERRNP